MLTFPYCLGGNDKLESNGVHRVQVENMNVDYTVDLANLGGRYSVHQSGYKFLHFDICRPPGSCVRTYHTDIVLGTEIYKKGKSKFSINSTYKWPNCVNYEHLRNL